MMAASGSNKVMATLATSITLSAIKQCETKTSLTTQSIVFPNNWLHLVLIGE